MTPIHGNTVMGTLYMLSPMTSFLPLRNRNKTNLLSVPNADTTRDVTVEEEKEETYDWQRPYVHLRPSLNIRFLLHSFYR